MIEGDILRLGNSKTSTTHQNKNQYYRYDSNYYDDNQYYNQSRPQRRNPKAKVVESEVKSNVTAPPQKEQSNSDIESV